MFEWLAYGFFRSVAATFALWSQGSSAYKVLGDPQPCMSVRPFHAIGLTPKAGGLSPRPNHALTCVVTWRVTVGCREHDTDVTTGRQTVVQTG